MSKTVKTTDAGVNGKTGGVEKMTNYPDNDFYSPNYSTDSGIYNTLAAQIFQLIRSPI